MPRQCAFCPHIANLTGEHLWGDWIGRLIGPRTFVFTRTELDGTKRRWNADELNLKAKVVCEACNNGWMSDLECETKPFLADMIVRGAETTLGARELATLAAFTFKNTVVADHMHDNRPSFFTLRERRDFRYTLSPPTGFQVWIGSIPDQHGVFKSMDYATERTARLCFQLNVFDYAIGHLALQSVTSRYLRRNLRRHAPQLYVTQDPHWNEVSIPCWPSDGSTIHWPGRAHMSRELFEQFLYRWKNLNVMPNLRRAFA